MMMVADVADGRAAADGAGVFSHAAEPDATLDPYAERILEAARALLLEHGLRRTSLADIADAADVSQATLYRRFPNRDELLRTLVSREVVGFIARVDEALAGIEEPLQRLVVAFVMFTRALREHELVQRLLVTDPERVLPALTTHGSAAFALGREYIAAQLRGAGADAVDPEQGAELLARVAHSLVLTPDTTLPLGDDDAIAALARTMIAPLVTS